MGIGNEILAILEYMEKEKGIPRADMISAITQALCGAAQRGVNSGKNLKIEINPKTGALKSWALYNIVDSVSDPITEIHIEKAYGFVEKPSLGGILQKEVDLSHLGRIAAQAARQAIMQKVRSFEKDRIYEHYRSMVGKIVSGTVRRKEASGIVVDLGKAEALLPPLGRIPNENYMPGDCIRCLLESIQNTLKGPEVILSRSSVLFVRRLFEIEVSEIADETVIIKNIVRDPGYRTKMIVQSNNPRVDPLGACVGSGGSRVKSIIKELGGEERIDVIRYNQDMRRMVEDALKPILPKNLKVDSYSKRIYFQVGEKELRTIIGHKGRNSRLISKLLGYSIQFDKDPAESSGFEQRMRKAVQGLHEVPGIEDAVAERLVGMGITTPEAFEGVTAADLTEGGFTADQAQEIIAKVESFKQHGFGHS